MTYVADQGLQSGDTLPSEPDLSRMFGVGRSTIREALMHLESDGLLTRRQGSGTVLTALASEVTVGLEVLEPMEARARRFGLTVTAVDVVTETVPASPELAERLAVDVGSPLLVVTRTLRSESMPLAVIRSYLTDRVVGATDALDHGNLAEVLFDRENAAFAAATLLPTRVSGEIATRLGMEDGDLALRIEQLLVGSDDLPRDWSEQWIASDRLRVEVLRRPARQRNTGSSPNPESTP
jgi:GntR family transcriptional regulator